MASLKDIWKNRKEIFEGIKNAIVRDSLIETIAEKRSLICNDCDRMGNKCAVPGTQPCCNECGCSLSFKTRSLSSDCPLEKWQALVSEKEEDKLNEL